MAIANTVARCLRQHEVPYEVVPHTHTSSSLETAEAAHISGRCLAKTVVLEDEHGYVMAVIPASYRLDLGQVHRETNRRLDLATEPELQGLFEDCDIGAIPPLGSAYGLETIVDDALAEQPEVYFEAGDHEQLIRCSSEAFDRMLENAGHSYISTPH